MSERASRVSEYEQGNRGKYLGCLGASPYLINLERASRVSEYEQGNRGKKFKVQMESDPRTGGTYKYESIRTHLNIRGMSLLCDFVTVCPKTASLYLINLERAKQVSEYDPFLNLLFCEKYDTI